VFTISSWALTLASNKSPAAFSHVDTGAVAGQKIDAVVFDLGGVLLDWDPRHLYRQLFADPAEMEDFLARICTPEWHRAHDLGVDISASCQRLAELHPRYRDKIMAWAERGEEMVAGQFDRTVRVLAEVKAAGTRCYTLSNMEPRPFALRSARFPFMTWFDGHVISGIEGAAKPDARIFEILLDRYRLAPEAAVFVDDVSRNVEAARALGMNAVHFTGASKLREALRALGVPGVASA
jgi:2-haloacid dehalogenase